MLIQLFIVFCVWELTIGARQRAGSRVLIWKKVSLIKRFFFSGWGAVCACVLGIVCTFISCSVRNREPLSLSRVPISLLKKTRVILACSLGTLIPQMTLLLFLYYQNCTQLKTSSSTTPFLFIYLIFNFSRGSWYQYHDLTMSRIEAQNVSWDPPQFTRILLQRNSNGSQFFRGRIKFWKKFSSKFYSSVHDAHHF